MRVMEMADYRVVGDLRHDFLEAYGRCLVALPGYRRAAPLGSGSGGEGEPLEAHAGAQEADIPFPHEAGALLSPHLATQSFENKNGGR
jgi:hypothetical protein